VRSRGYGLEGRCQGHQRSRPLPRECMHQGGSSASSDFRFDVVTSDRFEPFLTSADIEHDLRIFFDCGRSPEPRLPLPRPYRQGRWKRYPMHAARRWSTRLHAAESRTKP
jgi:hypothetical protein